MSRNISESIKKTVAAKQDFKCANFPDSNVIPHYNCIYHQCRNGTFDESGYEIDHIKEFSKTKNNSIKNLQALCIPCHRVKTIRFNQNKKKNIPKQISNIPKQISNIPKQISNKPKQISNKPKQISNKPNYINIWSFKLCNKSDNVNLNELINSCIKSKTIGINFNIKKIISHKDTIKFPLYIRHQINFFLNMKKGDIIYLMISEKNIVGMVEVAEDNCFYDKNFCKDNNININANFRRKFKNYKSIDFINPKCRKKQITKEQNTII